MKGTTNAAAVTDALGSYRYTEGRRVGLAGGSPSLAPGRPGDPNHEQWMQGWRSGCADRAEKNARRLALLSQCRYTVGACSCGGRGLCLDVA